MIDYRRYCFQSEYQWCSPRGQDQVLASIEALRDKFLLVLALTLASRVQAMASRVQALASKVQAMVLALALRAVLTIGITLKLELKKLIIIIIIINLIFFFFLPVYGEYDTIRSYVFNVQ